MGSLNESADLAMRRLELRMACSLAQKEQNWVLPNALADAIEFDRLLFIERLPHETPQVDTSP